MTSKPRISAGDVYGFWTLIERIPGSHSREPRWVCRCVCGVTREVIQSNLRSGKSRGCGCQLLGQATKTHGQARTPLYGAWRNMMDRCYREGNRQFSGYGGRGIKVCEEWHTFENFAKATGPHPGKGLSLDRIDNDGNYEPGNVRWTTSANQNRNRRNNRVLTRLGESLCLADWAAKLGVDPSHLYRRMRKGMTPEEAVDDIIKNPPKARGPYRKKHA